MKRHLFVAAAISLLIITGILLTSCNVLFTTRDAGLVITKHFDIKDFNTVEVGDGLIVNISASNTYDIEINTNENILRNITVVKDGNTLKIDHKWQGILGFSNNTIEAKITMPELVGLTITDGIKGTIQGFKSIKDTNINIADGSHIDLDMETGNINVNMSDGSYLNAKIKSTKTDITLSSGSRLVLDANTGEFNYKASDSSRTNGNVQATSTTIRLEDGSSIELTGSGSDLALIAADGSRAKLENFTIGNANIHLEDASYADMDINGKLTLYLHDGSKLVYGGNPIPGGKIDIDDGSKFERRE